MTTPLGFTPSEVASFAKELAPLLTNGGNLTTLIVAAVVIVLLHIVQMGMHVKTSKCFGSSVEFKDRTVVNATKYGSGDDRDAVS